MDTFSILIDKKIMGINVSAEMSVDEYFSFAREIIENNDLQRNPVKSEGKPYELLRRDLLEGCVIPPIILAITNDDRSQLSELITGIVQSENTEGHMSRVVAEINRAVIERRILILDGLQRTLTILSLLAELSSSGNAEVREALLKQRLRFEIYMGLSKQGILYRMLTLNTGQTPMSFRHQLEILYHDYLDGRNLPDGVQVLKEVDERRARGQSKYKFSDVVEMFYAYSTASPMPYDKQALVGTLRELSFLEEYRYSARGDVMNELLGCYNDFVLRVDQLSNSWSFENDRLPEISRPFGKSIPSIFARTQPMAGFGAECKRLIEKRIFPDVEGIRQRIQMLNFTADPADGIDRLLQVLDEMARKAKKIGDAQRLYFQLCFRSLLMPDSPNGASLSQVWVGAQETYEMLYT